MNARPDIAAGLGAQGVQLGAHDLPPATVRQALRPQWNGWIGASVHSVDDARAAADADFLIVGSIYPTATHPGQSGQGLVLLEELVALGRPVIAIGGITIERAREVHAAGAWGVATISAAWHAADPYRAAQALLAPWAEAA